MKSQQKTPLHIIMEHGYLSLATCLLKHGANPSSLDLNGQKPLHYIDQWSARTLDQLTKELAKPHEASSKKSSQDL